MFLGFGAWVLHAGAACSLDVLPYAHCFYCLLFTTLFSIDIKFEDLSILKTGQVLLSMVVEVSDLPHYDKYYLSSKENKVASAHCSLYNLTRDE